MTDQNNSGNSQPPTQYPSVTYIPGNITYTNVPTGGQWITYTINGIDYGTGQTTISSADKREEKKAKKKEEDGCVCKKCKEFYPYAEPNQEDGTLVCYGCRTRW